MAKAQAQSSFVSVTGQASKVKNFRHDPNGLKPFFDGLRMSKEDADALTYLIEEGCLVHVTISQAEKNLFEAEMSEEETEAQGA